MKQYKTVQGDTWDMIAYKTLGNEMLADCIMQANLSYIDIFIFPSGILLEIPEIAAEEVDPAPWEDSDEW